jgi:DNA-binding NarL/FixJ family response regulator
MASFKDYVLILDEQQSSSQSDLSFEGDRCAVVLTSSFEQVVAKAKQAAPCLVILAGDDQSWVKSKVHTLRQSTQAHQSTILALTDSTQPNWEPQEAASDLDGFLVRPLSADVLTSLIQSALIKREYSMAMATSASP